MNWPTAGLDPAAPFDTVWGFVSDLPSSVPRFDRDVASIEILERDGDRLKIISRSALARIPIRLDVELRAGWCWMVARPQIYVVGMAAIPAGQHTRFAMLEGVSLAGPRLLRSALAPVDAISRWRHRRHLPVDLDAIERALVGVGEE
jgi:hypothetical protein